MKTFGLIGKNIEYSFSRNYFKNKFEKLDIDAAYQNFDLEDLSQFKDVIKDTPGLKGLNVTIPYKEEIIKYLDELDHTAETIGAINTIKISRTGKLIGYNTDYYGFMESLKPRLLKHHKQALILGTGGAAKAIAHALELLKIKYKFVSRSSNTGNLNYNILDRQHFNQYQIIINSTPLGTFPNTAQHPSIPFQHLTNSHLVYDLIYNPSITALMQKASDNGAIVMNGLQMLELQAEKAWEIWNS